MRDVELHSERVVVRRRVSGIAMALNLPVNEFLGVALRVVPRGKSETVSITLEHPDPSLSIPLYRSGNSHEVVAEWQSWARALRRPLLVTDDNGNLHELFSRLGQVRLCPPPPPRRRRRTAMKGRRPSICWRRRLGIKRTVVHRGEREIIARN